MTEALFYEFRGSNKAIYFFNLSSWGNLVASMEFYKAISLRNSIVKIGLFIHLCVVFLMQRTNFFSIKTAAETEQNLKAVFARPSVNFNIKSDSSMHVSPETDKCIVHHHNNYFEKYFFGAGALAKAKSEVDAYLALKSNQSGAFVISKIDDVVMGIDCCSLKLANSFPRSERISPDLNRLVDVLVSLFCSVPAGIILVSEIVDGLKRDLLRNHGDVSSEMASLLDDLNLRCGEKSIPTGFEHGDFKIWNLNFYQSFVHIYDFEESKPDGLPVMDLFNFYLDPLVLHGKPAKKIISVFFDKTLQKMFQEYLIRVGVFIDCKCLAVVYFLRKGLCCRNREVSRRLFDLALQIHIAFEKQA